MSRHVMSSEQGSSDDGVQCKPLPPSPESRQDQGMGWWRWIRERDTEWAPKSRALLAHEFRSEIRFDWGVVGIGIAGTLWLWFDPQRPGIAIGLLAFFAAGMTLRDPSKMQRFIAIILAGFLFIVEAKSINDSGAKQEAQHFADIKALTLQYQAVLQQNKSATEGILGNATAQFSETERHFGNCSPPRLCGAIVRGRKSALDGGIEK
jgi:hypothetical protein